MMHTASNCNMAAFVWEHVLRKAESAGFTFEYNCNLRRLYPWPSKVETKRPITEFGVIWVRVDAGTAVDEHSHDEEETFIVTGGSATLILEGKSATLANGDVVYIPRNWRHKLVNEGAADFTFVDIYWDMGGRGSSAPEAASIGAQEDSR